MEQIAALCNDAYIYPRNLVHCEALEYKLTSYFNLLDQHERRLFSTEANAALDFLEFGNGGTGRPVHVQTNVIGRN